MHRVRKTIAGLLLGVAVFAPNAPVAAEDIKIGVLASLSGNWAQIGQNLKNGIELAAKEVNGAGGVLGKKLSFSFQDTDEEKSGAKSRIKA